MSIGRPYLVGEAGPELFVPSKPGSVIRRKIVPVCSNCGEPWHDDHAAVCERRPIED